MSTRVLTDVVTGETAGLERAMGRTQAATEKVGSKMSKLNAIAGKVAMGGLAVMAGGLYESAKAAVEAQANTDRLDQAIKHSGLSFGKTSGQLDKFASTQAKFGVSTNDAKGALAQFMVATGNAHRSMKELSLAEDIAAAKNIPLASAVNMVTKATAGSSRMMQQAGIIFKPTTSAVDALTAKYKALGLTTSNMTPQQQKVYNAAKRQAAITDKERDSTELLRIGFKKYTGDAAKESQTLQGKWATLHAQAQNLEVTIGNKLLPVITRLTNWMASHTGDVEAMAGAAGALTIAFGAMAATVRVMQFKNAISGIRNTGTAAATATPEVEGLDAAAGEGGLAGSLGLLGPAAIIAAGGLAAYYHSTQPNIHESSKLTSGIADLTAKTAAGSHTLGGFKQQMQEATKQGISMQNAAEKLGKNVLFSGQSAHIASQSVSDYATQMRNVAKNADAAAKANAKTNPTLSTGEHNAARYARAAANLAYELGHIPTRTQVEVDLETFASSTQKPGHGRAGNPHRTGPSSGSSSGSGHVASVVINNHFHGAVVGERGIDDTIKKSVVRILGVQGAAAFVTNRNLRP